jgi:hypothetical protein
MSNLCTCKQSRHLCTNTYSNEPIYFNKCTYDKDDHECICYACEKYCNYPAFYPCLSFIHTPPICICYQRFTYRSYCQSNNHSLFKVWAGYILDILFPIFRLSYLINPDYDESSDDESSDDESVNNESANNESTLKTRRVLFIYI